jgi:uncharacterized damage-inducible protein DinB
MSEAADKINDAHEQLLAAVAGLSEQQWFEPLAPGKWSLKGMVGHMIYWNQWGLDYARKGLAGMRPAGFPEDFELINQRAAAQWSRKNSTALIAELERIRDDYLDLLAQTEAEGDDTFEAQDGSTTVSEWLSSFADHQYYHCKQIRLLKE